MQKFLMALTTAVFLSTGTSAQAALIMGSESFNLDGINANYVPQNSDLLGITSFQDFQLTTNVGAWLNATTADPAGIITFAVSPLNIATLSSFSFGDSVFGMFQATQAATSSSSEFGQLSRTFFLIGTFTPGTAFVDPVSNSPFMTTAASFTITLNQSGGAGSTISGSASLNAPPRVPNLTTPEPASIAMFGTMLVPLALGAFRRRQKAAQAAL